MVTSTGKISVSGGYYNDGTAKHYFSETEKTFDEATTGQTKGCKNNLFAVIDNGVSDIAVCAGAIAGNPDWSVELPTKIYTDPTKSYILGTEPLKDINISYQNESSSINFSVVGSVTVTNNIAEGFNSSSYIELPDLFNHDGKSWEILIKFKVSSLGARRKLNGSHSGIDHLFPEIEIDSSNRFSLSIPTETGNGWQLYWTDTNAISANKWYWAKLSCSSSYVFTFEVSEDGNTYTTLKTHNGTKVYQSPYTMAIGTDIHASSGILPLTNGQIDLSESYIKIDGEYWWKALKETPASIKTASTGFVYKAPNTYNYPVSLEVPATSFTEQLGEVNDILYTNTAGSYRSSLMPIAVGQTPQGTYSSYAKSSSRLCRVHGGTDILGTEPTYEASLISGEIPNYTVVGSPTIDDSTKTLSNMTDSDHIISSVMMVADRVIRSIEGAIILNMTLKDVQTKQILLCPENSTVDGLYIQGKTFHADLGSVHASGHGLEAFEENDKVWVYINITNGNHIFDIAYDDGTYTVDTLPKPSQAPFGFYVDSFYANMNPEEVDPFINKRLQFGKGTLCTSEIHLSQIKVSFTDFGTTTTWAPYEESSSNAISESGWTGLDTSIAGTRGAVSFNKGTSSVKTFDDYFGHALAPSVRNYLWLVSYPSNAIADSSMNLTSLPSSTDGAAFTGYVVSTNSSRNAFESLEKIGTLCKAFYNSTSNLWVVIPVDDMQEGTFTATYYVASKDISATGSLPPVEASQAGTAEMTYDVTNETLEVVSTIFNFKGDLYFDLTNN